MEEIKISCPKCKTEIRIPFNKNDIDKNGLFHFEATCTNCGLTMSGDADNESMNGKSEQVNSDVMSVQCPTCKNSFEQKLDSITPFFKTKCPHCGEAVISENPFVDGDEDDMAELIEDDNLNESEVSKATNPDLCEHTPSEMKQQVHILYRVFPSQGDIGYRYNCTKCGCWLICECKRDLYMKYLPHYLDKFKQAGETIIFLPNVCNTCRRNDENEKQRWNKFKKVVEYIAKNDKDFFEYCYGSPVSGYEKDMEIRSKATELDFSSETMEGGPFSITMTTLKGVKPTPEKLKKEAKEAQIRQEKARRLINDYLFRTKDI